MSMQIVLQGTVGSDGTLQMDAKVAMPAGPVQVTIQPATQPPAGDPFWAAMERIWAEQKARAHVTRTKEQIDAAHEALRGEAEEELRAVEQVHQACQLRDPEKEEAD